MSQTNLAASRWKERYYICLLQGCGIGLTVTFLLLMLFAFLLLYLQANTVVLNLLTTAAGAFGGLAAGFFTARFYRKNGLLCGVLCGLILFFVLYLIGFLLGGTAFSVMLLIRACVMLLLAGIGGIWGVNSALKRKY